MRRLHHAKVTECLEVHAAVAKLAVVFVPKRFLCAREGGGAAVIVSLCVDLLAATYKANKGW